VRTESKKAGDERTLGISVLERSQMKVALVFRTAVVEATS
jgi:hypothetical protein